VERDLAAKYKPPFETVTGWCVGGSTIAAPVRFHEVKIGGAVVRDVVGDLFTGDKGAFADSGTSAASRCDTTPAGRCRRGGAAGSTTALWLAGPGERTAAPSTGIAIMPPSFGAQMYTARSLAANPLITASSGRPSQTAVACSLASRGTRTMRSLPPPSSSQASTVSPELTTART
jgi:hypothetical protein